MVNCLRQREAGCSLRRGREMNVKVKWNEKVCSTTERPEQRREREPEDFVNRKNQRAFVRLGKGIRMIDQWCVWTYEEDANASSTTARHERENGPTWARQRFNVNAMRLRHNVRFNVLMFVILILCLFIFRYVYIVVVGFVITNISITPFITAPIGVARGCSGLLGVARGCTPTGRGAPQRHLGHFCHPDRIQ